MTSRPTATVDDDGQEGLGASSLRADRATEASPRAPTGLGPDGSVSTGADDGWGWWAGQNEEFFNIGGPFATREAAINEGHGYDFEQGFYVVEAKLHDWRAPSADSVMDLLLECNDEAMYDDSPEFDGTREQIKAAEDDLDRVLAEWLDRHRSAILPAPTAFAATRNLEFIHRDSGSRRQSGGGEAGASPNHSSETNQ